MTLATVGDLIQETYVQLHDERLRARWSEAELLDYLGQAFEEAIALKPEIGATDVVLDLVEGTRQAIPTGAFRLLDISRNTVAGAPGRVIRKVDRDNLDGGDPDWHVAPPQDSVWEYAYDPKREPKRFYVNPPVVAGTQIQASVSQVPSYVTLVPGWESAAIPMDTVYHSAWINYMVYRALTKMADYALDDGRAFAHLKQFYFLIGAKHQADILSAPVTMPERVVRERRTEEDGDS